MPDDYRDIRPRVDISYIPFERNLFSIYWGDFSTPHFGVDQPFRHYHPFPKWDAAERRARTAAIEGRERLVAAWKVLRSGDRDPFDVFYAEEW